MLCCCLFFVFRFLSWFFYPVQEQATFNMYVPVVVLVVFYPDQEQATFNLSVPVLFKVLVLCLFFFCPRAGTLCLLLNIPFLFLDEVCYCFVLFFKCRNVCVRKTKNFFCFIFTWWRFDFFTSKKAKFLVYRGWPGFI